MARRILLDGKLPVGAIDTRASGWWAMIFVVFTEASLFAYLLFSYYYLAVQPHMPGTFPEGGAPSLALALPGTLILFASSVAVGWAQLGIEHGSKARLVLGLGLGAVGGINLESAALALAAGASAVAVSAAIFRTHDPGAEFRRWQQTLG